MSRVCVKNLPKHVAEDRLREFFSQKGEVTDAKIMRTREGKSRQFGFVGFRTEREAEEARNYFNKSFMDACRISCEIALKVGDPSMPRPWSRHSVKKMEITSEEEKKLDKPKVSKAVLIGYKQKNRENIGNDDPQLQEFLEVMQHSSRPKLWANDAIAAPTSTIDLSEKPFMHKFQTAKASADKLNDKDADLDGFDEDGKDISSEGELHNPSKLNDEFASDVDYFKSRIKKSWSDSESTDDKGDADGGDKHFTHDSHTNISNEHELDVPDGEVDYEASAEKHMNDLTDRSSSPDKRNDSILEYGRLFIRNLPYTATEEEVEAHFGKYGIISQVHIVIDKSTRRSKGIAYVQFSLPESATRAVEEMDCSIFQGRLLHVMPAEQKILSSNTLGNNNVEKLSAKSFKQQRQAERKASEASGNTQSWNSLFMRPDTVVENISRKAGISKNELLDRESDDLAVRIALGETQVIAETKKALVSAGVNISSLEEFAAGKSDGLKRNNHVILVKNLPYGSSESELSDMFGKFGSLDKIILPPTKTLALVIFLEPVEARAAFKGLAYKRYKDGPLYLEWAPADVLNQQSPVGDIKVMGEVGIKRALLERELEDISDANIDLDRVESRSLYVKNLNFKTSEEILKSHFAEHMTEGKILSARVKKHLKNGKNVSMGFGFLEFDTVDTTVMVCRDLQGTILDGHALILQQCHVKKDEILPKTTETDRSSTKLIIRNVAFEATDKDLRQLFAPFGQIKSLRLPMRFGKHRGFAFIEYTTKQETKNALEALSNTHLYGRHLVLERAKEGESLEELRVRTGAQFMDSQLSKKRKQLTILDEASISFKNITE